MQSIIFKKEGDPPRKVNDELLFEIDWVEMSYVEKELGAQIRDIEIAAINMLELIIKPLFYNNNTDR
jgi:hypothetical protein